MKDLERLEQRLESGFKTLFSKNETRFLGFFALIFLGTAGLLAGIGLLPSELKENLGTSAPAGSLPVGTAPSGSSGGMGPVGQNSALGILNATGQGSGTANSGSNAAGTGGTGANGNAGPGSNPSIADNRLIVPDRIMVPSLGINAVVRNPTSTSISHLDSELTKGAVRYPGSGTIGKGNMFIFGHSTGLSVVQNQAYRIFNELHKTKKGDEILLTSGSTTFVYKVRSVSKVDKNDTLVKFDTATNMLTISTCDSFGSKSDRYVVEADYVGVR